MQSSTVLSYYAALRFLNERMDTKQPWMVQTDSFHVVRQDEGRGPAHDDRYPEYFPWVNENGVQSGCLFSAMSYGPLSRMT